MISVVIPVYNGAKYLQECLESVCHPNIQIIVIDDGSTDLSAKIAHNYTDIVISTKHQGPVKARNIGIQKASEQYILFIDADDILRPNSINELIKNIPNNDVVIGQRQNFISPDCKHFYRDNPKNITQSSTHGVITGCALFRKNIFDTVGLFDENLLCGDGYEWLLRASKLNIAIKYISSILCDRRLHCNNMGILLQEQEKADYCKIIKKHFIKQ